MLLTTLLAVAALHIVPQPVSLPQNTSEATAEGTEILRRILVESLNDAFAKKRKDGDPDDKVTLRRQGFQVHDSVTELWFGDQTVQHARAFHMPDAGLFFALDAAL